MRESRTFGSVGGEGGNVLAYPAISCRQRRFDNTGENDPYETWSLCVLRITSHRNNQAAPHGAKSPHLSICFKTEPFVKRNSARVLARNTERCGTPLTQLHC
jgi:hypothetical protein